MNSPDKISRLGFVIGMLKLGLHHTWRETLAGSDFYRTITERSPIFRLTVLWDGMTSPLDKDFDPEKIGWNSVVKKLEDIIYNNQASPETFESSGYELLMPLAKPRIDKDIKAWPWVPEGYSPVKVEPEQVFGCFAYELTNRTDASFHICNACMPDSPFGDISARKQELLKMAEHLNAYSPGIKFLKCNSWLNAFPPFQALFPPEYPCTNKESPLGIGYNWWGQFMSRSGDFHEKHGDMFRENSSFPFPAIDGICSLTALKKHLIEQR